MGSNGVKDVYYMAVVSTIQTNTITHTNIVNIPTGIDKYYWCVGSKLGYCDIMPYMETTEPESSSRPQDDLQLTDGHPVYVSVQVRLRVAAYATISHMC